MTDANLDQIVTRRSRRRVYGRDFKLQIVRLATQGLSSVELVRDFSVSPVMVARWLREWQQDPMHAFRGYGQRKPHQDQVDRLRRQVNKLRAERDLLKKASARFVLKPHMPTVSLQSIEQSGR